MATTSLAPFIRFREVDLNGLPLAGGKLYAYQAGTSTPQATYTDSTGVTPNANPIILDASGRAAVWLDVSLSYKFVLKDSSGSQIWSEDGVIGLASNNSIPTAALQDGAVTTAKIADDAVTAAKLADSTTIDASRAVTTDHIRNSAITSSKVGDSALSPSDVLNMGYTAAVASNALTIARKQSDAATDHTAALPGVVVFRSSTITSGSKTIVKSTAAASITIPAGTTLGTVSGVAELLQIFEINNAGTMEIGVGTGCSIDESALQNTLAVSGGVTRGQIYSTTARSSVAVRLIGQLKITEATAGTWATSPASVSLLPFPNGPRSQVILNTSNGYGSTNNKILRLTNTVKNVGTAITYADSATLGASFTINEDGIYAIALTCGGNNGSATAESGISRNSNQLTTSLSGITAANRLAMSYYNGPTASTGITQTTTWIGELLTTDVIRPHTDGNSLSNTGHVQFTITKVAA